MHLAWLEPATFFEIALDLHRFCSGLLRAILAIKEIGYALLDVYADDGMTLEQLMAFTVSTDHARQVQVWEAVKNSWNKEPSIRRMLTETSVRASERRAVLSRVISFRAMMVVGSRIRTALRELRVPVSAVKLAAYVPAVGTVRKLMAEEDDWQKKEVGLTELALLGQVFDRA